MKSARGESRDRSNLACIAFNQMFVNVRRSDCSKTINLYAHTARAEVSACLLANACATTINEKATHRQYAPVIYAYVCASATRKVSASKCAPPLAQMRYPALISVPMPSINTSQNYASTRRDVAAPFKDDTQVLNGRRSNQEMLDSKAASYDRRCKQITPY